MASILLGFGILLAGLGLVVQQSAPEVERIAFLTGVTGGGLSLFWGLAAMAGLRGRKGAILSTIVIILVLLTRTVHVWIVASEAASGPTVRLVVTLMFLTTMGMLLYLFHGERPPEFYERKATPHHTPAAGGEGQLLSRHGH